MRKLVMAAMLGAMLALPAAVVAHPSENRNDNGFGGGPHCHFVTAGPTDSRAYPSHTAHLAQLAHGPAGAVFVAAECD